MDGEYFVSINDVAKRLSVPAHTLRYWEKQFPTAIRPTTGAGGRRYYRPETVDKLVVIKDLLYSRGMTIAGVKKLIHEGNLPKDTDSFVVKSNAPQSHDAATNSVTVKSSDDIDAVISLLNTAREILGTV